MTEARPHRPILALLLRLGAALVLSVMMAIVKLAEQGGVHLAEILFWRQLPTVPILLLWFAFNGGLARLATRRVGAHVRRALIGLASMALNFGSLILLPLAEATVLVFTAAIWAVILSAVFLKEKVGPYRWSAVFLGFVGVAIIAQPGSAEISLLGTAVALGAAVLIGLLSILIRDLGRTEEPLTVVFYFALFCLPILGAAMPFVHEQHSLEVWGLLAALGLLGLIAQFLVTASLRFGAVASVLVMDYTSLVWAVLLGWGLFDRLPPDSTWIGAPVVVCAGLIVAWREHRLERERLDQLARARGTATLG